MFRKLLQTSGELAPMVLRLVLGIVFFAHGSQKMLGWFGGYGLDATMNAFTKGMGIPAPLAFLAIAAEFFGGRGLIAGLLTRVAAFGIASVMVVAVVKVHSQFGLFMNWAGNQKGEGFEYHALVIAITVALMIAGGGAFSADLFLSRSRSPAS